MKLLLSYLLIILLYPLVDIMEDQNTVFFHLRKIVIIGKRGDMDCVDSKIRMF